MLIEDNHVNVDKIFGWASFLWFLFSLLALGFMPSAAAWIPNKKNCWVVLYLLAVLSTAGPIFSVLIAGLVASAAGCSADEGGPHPCMIFGYDFGEIIYALGTAGWFGIVTIPIGLVVILKNTQEHRKRMETMNP